MSINTHVLKVKIDWKSFFGQTPCLSSKDNIHLSHGQSRQSSPPKKKNYKHKPLFTH